MMTKDDQCNAGAAQGYIGTEANADVREALSEIALGAIRYIRPGEPVTADLWYGRMNVHLSDTDIIGSIYCDR